MTRIIILGAAGRDFHNFNIYYRDNTKYTVVCFTATQIPDIEGRKYPTELCGKLYPDGLPIFDQDRLEELIKKYNVEECVFSYSDVSHITLMRLGCRCLAAGVDFKLLTPAKTQYKSTKPLIAIGAIRTGCGKSQTTRFVADILKAQGKKIAVIRHPMPYGGLNIPRSCQRFETLDDLKLQECTIEEIEEYEPHIMEHNILFAGIDYGTILREAEKECDVVLWDGGNNDTSFYKSDLNIIVIDPHRPNHELLYFPGNVNFLQADVIIINKIDSAKESDIQILRDNIKKWNPTAKVIEAESEIGCKDPSMIKGKKVLIVEDGPTVTHGEMAYGAGFIAAKKYGAGSIVDPRPFAIGSIKKTFEKFTHLEKVLPAMGYGEKQVEELQETINNSDCEVVLIGTPIDLTRILTKTNKPTIRITYDLKPMKGPKLEDLIKTIF